VGVADEGTSLLHGTLSGGRSKERRDMSMSGDPHADLAGPWSHSRFSITTDALRADHRDGHSQIDPKPSRLC